MHHLPGAQGTPYGLVSATVAPARSANLKTVLVEAMPVGFSDVSIASASAPSIWVAGALDLDLGVPEPRADQRPAAMERDFQHVHTELRPRSEGRGRPPMGDRRAT